MSQVVGSLVGERRKSVESVGSVLFTGPDGLGDHRTKVLDPSYVGHTTRSPADTADVEYLFRPYKVRESEY